MAMSRALFLAVLAMLGVTSCTKPPQRTTAEVIAYDVEALEAFLEENSFSDDLYIVFPEQFGPFKKYFEDKPIAIESMDVSVNEKGENVYTFFFAHSIELYDGKTLRAITFDLSKGWVEGDCEKCVSGFRIIHNAIIFSFLNADDEMQEMALKAGNSRRGIF